ncbi:MAG: hypothetical protein IPK53_08280 [bacterium]|nr:hypothetical protein [bacterium]
MGFTSIHNAFRFVTLFFEVGLSGSHIVRFFKIPSVFNRKTEIEILKDFKRLTKMGGGTTDCGYVLRDGLSDDLNWSYEANDPELQKKIQDMMQFGDVQPLEQLVEIRRGLRVSRDPSYLLNGTKDEGIPLIEARNIMTDNILNIEDTRHRVKDISPDIALKAGDICVRHIIGPDQRLTAVCIQEEILPLAVADSVVILRPKSKEVNVDFLLSYLQSDTANIYLRSRGSSITLPIQSLRELPVPILDDNLATAWESLKDAKETFNEWQEEVQSALNSLFAFQSVKDARLHLLSTGRLLRQRQQAAMLVDSLAYRIRTQFPHPLAYRWRTIEASKPDLEGLVHILECAEITVCYLAITTILISRAVEEINIKYLENLSEKLTDQKHGIGFGDWVAILREIRDSKATKKFTKPIPFYEATRFLDDGYVDEALQFLTNNRNKQFHRKGAQGIQIPARFSECKDALETLFSAIEFLSEYDLRYVEETLRDSIVGITKYSYRSLMGDHPLSPIMTSETPEIELEAHSLYLKDKNGQLHLLRPLLTRRVCPTCGRWTTFHLDSYNKKTDTCNLNGLEHGHLVEDGSLVEAFKHVGLLI